MRTNSGSIIHMDRDRDEDSDNDQFQSGSSQHRVNGGLVKVC